ncbi:MULTISPECIES: LWR-salt protein [Saliphagus]|uniref:LWR-salt protein n=1 Tax=Saliphagus infecundisoli TaxID=1849069 RepID=A0ABD5QHH3_9EURY|nr:MULTISPECIES: LWR-salt protein [Saliphagus]
MGIRYAFGVRLRPETPPEISLEPPTIERRCLLSAPEPGSEGWLEFRELVWRGEVSDREHVRRLLAEKIGIEVESVDFRALEADPDSFERFKEAVADDLEAFNAENVSEVLTKYFGSSLEIREP